MAQAARRRKVAAGHLRYPAKAGAYARVRAVAQALLVAGLALVTSHLGYQMWYGGKVETLAVPEPPDPGIPPRLYQVGAITFAESTPNLCQRFNSLNPRLIQCAPDSYVHCTEPQSWRVRANYPYELATGPALIDWNTVALLIVTTAARAQFLEASARTWLSRLSADAHLLIVPDRKLSVLPRELRDRPKTYLYSRNGADHYATLDAKVRDAFLYAATSLPPAVKYFIKVDDDTLVIPLYLRQFLTQLDKSIASYDPLYFGKANCANKRAMLASGGRQFCHAQGGCYGMNRAALDLFQLVQGSCGYWKDLSSSRKLRANLTDRTRYEDVMMGRCLLEQVGVPVTHCESFFPQNPSTYLIHDKGNILRRMGGESNNSKPISFHHMSPSAVLYMDNFLYGRGRGKHTGEAPRGDLSFHRDNPDMKQLNTQCRRATKFMECNW